jgi:phosphatidylserine/phosphatidylglycerophosphate/cardiolipin synthase-like enzyme
MGKILKVTAYANNEIAVIAWQLDGMIDACLGFEITRIYLSGPEQGTEKVLPAWVAFKGQRNPKWTALTTSTWPVQKLIWRDLTLRKHRADLERHPDNIDVRYRVRALLSKGQANMKVPSAPPGSYVGNPVDLYYQDQGVESNAVHISYVYSDQLTAAFTNGILSTQWLSHTLDDLKTPGTDAFKAVAAAKKAGASKPKQTVSGIMTLISDQNSPVRAYLGGDVPGVLRTLPDQAVATPGSWLNMALYELNDQELIGVIKDNAKVTDLILSNTSMNKTTKAWDSENQPARKLLGPVLASLQNRMFNNSGHIGHNKFVVLSNPKKTPQAVLTGSTNWTPNGLCAQSNNAMIIKSPDLAQQYLNYWNDLSADNKQFTTPRPLTKATSNVQGSTLRTHDADPLPEISLRDGTTVQLWRSPNTQKTTLGTDLPPDLAQVYSLMRKASDAILFAVYLPSGSGLHSVIEEAVDMGMKDPNLLVYGAISDPMAMWTGAGAAPKAKKGAKAKPKATGAKKAPPSPIFDQDNVHLVLAKALDKLDATGDFEAEMLSAGFAIIHDKIVVIDPLSANATIVMGSHNFGYKASYCNDDNLLIIRNNELLAQAYAAHIIDLYEHYRFRAVESSIKAKGGTLWDGFLSVDSLWLQKSLQAKGMTIARYLSR